MNENYQRIQEIMEEYSTLLDQLVDFEKNKLDAVKAKNLEQLDNFLKDEQVHLLSLKGLDVKREKIQNECGLEGLTYRQIIDKAPEELKAPLQASYDQISEKTSYFQELVRTINTYIDIQLHTIEAVMERIGAEKSQPSGIYDSNAREEKAAAEANQRPHSFRPTKA